MAPFIVTTHESRQLLRGRLRRRRPPARAGVRVPVARRLRRRRHRRGHARHGPDARQAACACSSTWARTREIALGNQDGVVATAAPAGPAFEAAQIRCGMRAAEGAIEGVGIAERRDRAGGDRRHRAGRASAAPGSSTAVAELVRAGLLDHSGRFVPTRRPRRIARRSRRGSRRSARSACSCCTGRRGPRLRRCTSPSATSASCSSRRPRSPRAGRSCSRSSASSPRTSRRCCSPARSAQYLSPVERGPDRARAADGAAADRLGRERRRRGREDGGAVAARARRGARDRATRCEYVELSGRADFNDRFIDELAFPG